MGRSRTAQVMVQRVEGTTSTRGPDQLIVEEPLEIRLDGHLVTTTMRTPGHDFELACGLCFTDGLLAGAEIRRVRYCATGPALATELNVVTVESDGTAPIPSPRLTLTSSSCGLCGSANLAELRGRLKPLTGLIRFDRSVLAGVLSQVRAEQTLFSATGGVHSAAAFDAKGTLSVVREDVGRHNAVDKVVGRLLLDGRLPASGLGLFVSGRASFEIVQKAWAAGFAAVVAVSAPTSLAVEAAREAGLTLVGFVRGARMNIYTDELNGVP